MISFTAFDILRHLESIYHDGQYLKDQLRLNMNPGYRIVLEVLIILEKCFLVIKREGKRPKELR